MNITLELIAVKNTNTRNNYIAKNCKSEVKSPNTKPQFCKPSRNRWKNQNCAIADQRVYLLR